MPFYLWRNPRPTRASIIAWTVFGAVVGAMAAFRLTDSVWMIPAVSLAGGLIAALVEWLREADEYFDDESPDDE